MNKRILVATFAHEEGLLGAAEALRGRGLKLLDAYTPYPVHGLDEAIGLPPSRLPWACAALGAVGAGAMWWLQHWTSAVDWPINVGGKPWDSLPAFVPVIFESMVLAAGVGTVLLFFLVSRLRPGRRERLVIPEVTDDRFALVVEETDAAFDLHALRPVLQRHDALLIEERVLVDEPPAPASEKPGRAVKWVNLGLAASLVAVIAGVFALSGDDSQRNMHFLPTMVRSPAYDAYAIQDRLAGEWGPPPGAVSRESSSLHYAATDEDAKRAGEELSNPFEADDAAALARGALVYQNFCASCHGAGGQGDGPVAQRGFPPPPAFQAGNSRTAPDGELLHIITYGRRSMPPHDELLDEDDRWKVILHIRQFQTNEETP
jgi:mono/diheme cytochrome c family protein